MTYNVDQQAKTTARVRKLFVATLALGCAFGTIAHAQNVTPPPTPTLITPPAGNSAFLVGHALGTQGYVCLPTVPGASTASWTVNAARPEATLFLSPLGQNFQIITHFLSPNEKPSTPQPVPFGNATWQSHSIAVGVGSGSSWKCIRAGDDPTSCRNTGSIACHYLDSWCESRANGRHTAEQNQLYPTLKH